MENNNLPLVLTIQDVAEILGIGKNTAYRLVQDGKLNAVRVGRQIRIPRTELYRYPGIAG